MMAKAINSTIAFINDPVFNYHYYFILVVFVADIARALIG